MTAIVPTVGRVVLFHPQAASRATALKPTETYAAIVASVLANGKLNLAVFDGGGRTLPMTDVPLIQEGETAPAVGYYAEWMAYQKAVASGAAPAVLHAVPAAAPVATAPAAPAPAAPATSKAPAK